ncbi:kinase-like domain-containing protein [Suillus bovinus]|uniref:kinase-like domain-containing protein n=1 Tax=Suillus bovinus TaxID=48563 RepID=UPI001B876419|nr:kinase-like domain-containing protein [Suillus bovinus]KAG2140931.1 kinase-like domain-containing protein [Suillus bovinus]
MSASSVDFIRSIPVTAALVRPLQFLFPGGVGGSTPRCERESSSFCARASPINMLTPVKTLAILFKPDLPCQYLRRRGQRASTYGSFIVDTSTTARTPYFPTASGGLGDVYACILNRGTGLEEVAVKSPRFPSLADADVARINHNLDREIKVWTRLNHRYVLRLYGTVTGFGPFRALVSPWMENGTLSSYLTGEGRTLTTMARLRILKQITEGLKYLHDKNVIHGDLTSNNVLIAADGSPRLADFGVSNIMVKSNPAFSYQTGAVRWAAPELIVLPEGQTVQFATQSSDIYALGCIILQVLYDKLPYWWIKTALQVMSSKFKNQEPINNTIQIQAHHLNFMRRCWSIKSENRPSVKEVLDFLERGISTEAST